MVDEVLQAAPIPSSERFWEPDPSVEAMAIPMPVLATAMTFPGSSSSSSSSTSSSSSLVSKSETSGDDLGDKKGSDDDDGVSLENNGFPIMKERDSRLRMAVSLATILNPFSEQLACLEILRACSETIPSLGPVPTADVMSTSEHKLRRQEPSPLSYQLLNEESLAILRRRIKRLEERDEVTLAADIAESRLRLATATHKLKV